MKQTFLILTMMLISCQTNVEKNSVDFQKFVFNLSNPSDSLKFLAWQKTQLTNNTLQKIDTLFSLDSIPIAELLYFDKQFSVYGYCNGEFGGALLFKENEIKDSIYYLPSTCPVMIEKRTEGYYITESLAHMVGFGKVQFFKSPKELVQLHVDSLKTNWSKRKYPELTESEIWDKLENQGEVLIDSIGLTFNMFFSYQTENYLIYSDSDNTYLGLLTGNGLTAIDTLLNQPTWRYNNPINNRVNDFCHYNFLLSSSIGHDKIITKVTSWRDIYAKSDTIVIAYKYIEKTKSR